MDDTRWRQIDKLFEQALELEEDRREVFLEQRCAGDGKLRRSVERLLALEVEARSFLAEPAGVVEPEPSSILDGLRIGPYRLLHAIGHGGMGSVYLARREDDYRQEVAIKLVRHQGLLSEEARRRFRHERQVLARLAHPNVARLYDGGTSEGLPYLVMEHVEGLPIDRYCDRHRLTLRRRLALFREVCSAVSHAHRRLLVHCDIKPSNILVTAKGTVKLLDFGIAKLLGGDDPDETTLTRGLRPLTPGYASPEQVLAEPITTAADVYSLGVLLYHLLCGRLPHVTGNALHDLGSMSFDQEPVKPSRRVLERPSKSGDDEEAETLSRRRRSTPRELSRQLRGDLDAIVLKALRREPEKRYASVDELSDDVERHLALVPVRARRGTWRYRAGRLLHRLFLPPDPRRRRERLLWASLLAAILIASWALPILRRPGVPCGDAAARLSGVWAPEIRSAIRDAFLATQAPFAEDVWRRIEASLGDYARAWTTMHVETCEATHVRGEQSERMLDARMACLDGHREELRALTRLLTEADLDVVLKAPEAIGELQPVAVCADRTELSSVELPPNDPALRRRIDTVRAVTESQALRHKMGLAVDFVALRQAVETARELRYRPVLARALFVSGSAESREQGARAGLEPLESALLAAIAGGDRRLQTRIYAELARVEIRNGNAEIARRWSEYTRASLEALGSGNEDLRYEVALATGFLAWETGRFAESKAEYMRALEIAERGSDPARLIQALTSAGMFGQLHYLERAIELTEREFGSQNVNNARALTNLAAEYGFSGQYDEALPRAQRAIELFQATYGEDHPDLGYPLTLAAQILSAQGRPAEAFAQLQRARPLIEAGLGGEAPLLADVRHALASVLYELGRYHDALDHALAADRIYAATKPPAHFARLALLSTLGNVQRALGDLPAALESHERLLSMIRAEEPFDQASPLLAIGETLLEAGRDGEAAELLEEALEKLGSNASALKRARIRFALARSIRVAFPKRSRQLALEASDELGDVAPLQKQLKERIGTWLYRMR